MNRDENLENLPEATTVFVDANIFLHHAFGTNNNSIEFLKRVEKGSVKAYTSVLVLEEVFFKLLMQQASNYLEKVNVEKVKAFLKEERNRDKIFGPIFQYLKYIKILKSLGLKVIEVRDEDIEMALNLARKWGIIAADAFHLAVMQRKLIVHLISDDSDFERAEDINLWRPVHV